MVASPTLRHGTCAALVAVSVVLGLTACGDDSSHDKSQNELNVPERSAPADADAGYTTYTGIRDSTGAISYEVPAEWTSTDLDADPNGFYQAVGSASPNLDGFRTTWDTPGVVVAVSRSLGARVAAKILPDIALPNVKTALQPPANVLEQCATPVVWGIRIHGLYDVTGPNIFEEHLSDLLQVGFAYQYAGCGRNDEEGRPGVEFIEIVGYSHEGAAVLHIQLQNVRQVDVDANLRALASLQVNWASVPQPTAEQLASAELALP